MTSKAETCPECGEPIPVGAGLGFCPSCIVTTTVLGEGDDAETEIRRREDDDSEWIGPYRIVRMLAEGGFGEVYLAEQENPAREVALKVLKKGMDTKQVVARFKAEEQALALMDHNSIATVYDAGETEDGRPYFAMEYVKGSSITTFCNKNELSFDAMLELFREVCLAVHHAHQKGIIHRDIKPSNIMVARDENGKPVPKVIDFGIAKAMQHMFLGTTMITGINETIGTPEYMSPEQTESGGLDIDTTTDIYSLGVVLYELLTGQPPFRLDKSMDKLRQSVVNKDANAPRPTLQLETASDHVLQFARMRQMEPAAFKRRVKGDLDWIVMKAIDKDRERRYVSAAAFAEDLRCFLSHEPVKARPPSFFYQARKYVRRHRIGVAVAAVVLVSLVGTAMALDSARRQSAATTAHSRLIAASPEGVPEMFDRTDEYLPDLAKVFRKVADDPASDRSEWLRASLALLPVEPSRAMAVSDRIDEATPDEMRFILKRLEPVGDTVIPPAEALIARPGEDDRTRLRAAAMLARFDPGNEQLQSRFGEVAFWLTSEELPDVAAWKEIFRPVSESLVERLKEYCIDESGTRSREIAAILLGDYRAGDVGFLLDLVEVANPRQLPFIVRGLADADVDAREALRSLLSGSLEGETSETVKDRLADRMSRAGFALIKLGYGEDVWPYLRHGGENEDTTLRSSLVHGMATYSVNPLVLMELFDSATDASIRRAALTAIGGYGQRAIPPALKETFGDQLERAFKNDPDAGIHSAVEMLLRNWGKEDVIRLMQGDMKKRTKDIDLSGSGANFYINSEGHTMVVIEGPVEFDMGSLNGESDEMRHRRRIPRSFAIATMHVSVGQFHEIREEYARLRHEEGHTQGDDEFPLNDVRSSDALHYCIWLSEREGIPREEWCYQQVGDSWYPSAVENALEKTGYRLPTEAEWEYACRAGAVTPWPWGTLEEFSRHYAWTKLNSNGNAHRRGMLAPNDLGLFDMLGSLPHWCHEYYEPYSNRTKTAEGVFLDDVVRPTSVITFLQRGGNYMSVPARSAQRLAVEKSQVTQQANSFRIARTIATHSG